MSDRIRVIKISRRPGFTHVHGGWSEYTAQDIAARVATLKGPRRYREPVPAPSAAQPELASRVLGVHRDMTTPPRQEPEPFRITGRDLVVVLVVIGLVLLWSAIR